MSGNIYGLNAHYVGWEARKDKREGNILIVLRSLFWSHKLRTRPLSMNDHEKNPRNLKNTPQKMPPYNQTFNLMYCTLFCFTGK